MREKDPAVRCTAVVVAAGSGKRMHAREPKQFLELQGRPILFYTLDALEHSAYIDAVILVTADDLTGYCRQEIVRKYGFRKVRQIVSGGAERSDSVYAGLVACPETDLVFIQDGVRPFLTEQILADGYACALEYGTAVAGVPAKDTIKITDAEGIVRKTPPRKNLWAVQTPQIFRYESIRGAYEEMREDPAENVTDDAMVMELYGDLPVRMYEASYSNIKITTPEDLLLAGEILREIRKTK